MTSQRGRQLGTGALVKQTAEEARNAVRRSQNIPGMVCCNLVYRYRDRQTRQTPSCCAGELASRRPAVWQAGKAHQGVPTLAHPHAAVKPIGHEIGSLPQKHLDQGGCSTDAAAATAGTKVLGLAWVELTSRTAWGSVKSRAASMTAGRVDLKLHSGEAQSCSLCQGGKRRASQATAAEERA